jgi:hypothetical protein
MPLIQIELTEKQSEKIEHYKILKKLQTKQEAILHLIDELEIEVRIKKDGNRTSEVRLKPTQKIDLS